MIELLGCLSISGAGALWLAWRYQEWALRGHMARGIRQVEEALDEQRREQGGEE